MSIEIQNNTKTLVVLLGSARGGEETWNSMYNYLLNPLSADLALLFGKTKDHSSSLYKKARYIWELEEYSNWWDYFKKNFSDQLYKIFKHNEIEGLGGGVDNFKGSGAIIFAFRHFLKNNFKNELLKYDRIILTRSDYFYIDFHPILKNDYFYIAEGESYGGVSDRHHVFSTKIIDDVLGILEYLDDSKNYKYLIEKSLNPERALYEFYKNNEIIKKIKFCKRVQFIVTKNNDKTRWSLARGYMFGSNSLQIKYQREYYVALKNKYGIIIGLFLRFLFHFFKKN